MPPHHNRRLELSLFHRIVWLFGLSSNEQEDGFEMLSDNGFPYTARDTRIFAYPIGLKSCFTTVDSSQSNGISEAFIKKLKRDYVRVNPLPDANTALDQIED